MCSARSPIRRDAVAGLCVFLFSLTTHHQPRVFSPLMHYFRLVDWFFMRFLFICFILKINNESWEYWRSQAEHVTFLVRRDWPCKPYHPVHLLSVLIKYLLEKTGLFLATSPQTPLKHVGSSTASGHQILCPALTPLCAWSPSQAAEDILELKICFTLYLHAKEW